MSMKYTFKYIQDADTFRKRLRDRDMWFSWSPRVVTIEFYNIKVVAFYRLLDGLQAEGTLL